MNTSRLELSVGAFVLTGLIAIAYLALKIGAGAFGGGDTYAAQARFANAAGVNPGANVTIAGVTVGRVDGVRLDPADFSAIVELRLRRDVRLPVDSIVSVRTSGLIGDKFLAVQPGVEDELVAPGGMFIETESTVDLESLIGRMAFGGAQNKEQP